MTDPDDNHTYYPAKTDGDYRAQVTYSKGDNLNLQSEDIQKLAEALAKAQKKPRIAKADKKNPFFNSKYADLESVLKASEGIGELGLSVTQTMYPIGDNTFLITTLLHSSGQFLRSFLPLNPQNQDPQKLGAYITYMRRYALSAILNIAVEGEDDDGNTASQASKATKSNAPSASKATSTNDSQAPNCDLCGALMKLSRSGKKYFCPNFKDTTNGEHTVKDVN